ncbi:MAG: hypothetical protein OXI87_02200 [Albidovulum sp.]|nr:hypothetical protein [Albidovulum sp.]
MEEHEEHRQATAERCALEPLVFAVQGSATVRCRSLEYFEDFARLGIGMETDDIPVQFGLALNAAGRPLGVYDLHAGVRRATRKGVRQISGLDRARELADACPRTRVIYLCECTFGEFIDSSRKLEGTSIFQARRAERHRVLRGDGSSEDLFRHMDRQPVLASMRLDVASGTWPSRRRRRTANLELRAARIKLMPSKSGRRTPYEFTSVYAREVKRNKPVRWLLITNEGQADAETAKNVVGWHAMSGVAEEFSTVLEIGFRSERLWPEYIGDLRYELAQAVETSLEVYNLQRLSKANPELLAIDAVTEVEIFVLHVLSNRIKKGAKLDMKLSIAAFLVKAAGLVGFHPSNSQTMPGTGERKVCGRVGSN